MPPRILIVEDDKHTRRILESLLGRDPALADLQPEIIVTQDGVEGLEQLKKGTMALVISDLLMPRMDGFQFCRELRKLDPTRKVPLIVTSAIYKDPAAIHKLHAETGAEFFAKPFQMRELITLVRKLLLDGRAQQAATLARVAVARTAVAPTPKPETSGGKLSERVPGRVLLDLSEERSTGLLSITRAKVRKDVVLIHGTTVAVTSNLRAETLGHFLVARGFLDENRHQQALAQAQQSHDRLGHVLVELGWLTEKELLNQLTAQMRAKLASVLRWNDGTWMFTPGQPANDRLHTPVETPRVVFRGLEKTAHIDEIAQTLVRARGRVGLTLRAERHREAFARVFGAAGLEALQRRPLLEDLMSGPDPSAMLIQLDALMLCGMAELEPAHADPEPTSPDALRRMLSDADSSPATVAVPPAKLDLYDELFGGEISEVKPVPIEPESFEEDEPSAVTQLPSAVARTPPRPPVDAVVEGLRKEVLSTYLALHGKDHYQVLGVRRDAPPTEISAAYTVLAKQFRLERFAEVDLGTDYARVEEIHLRLREAFETLSVRPTREAYDRRTIASARQQPLLDAELLARQAEQKLAAADPVAARAKLVEAVQAAPDQADYHALLGWATFLAQRGQSPGAAPEVVSRAAQAAWPHLEQALAIDPGQIDANEFAGRIFVAAGDDDRAAGHLEQVLDADPKRDAALAALEAAHVRRGEWRRLEREYRKLIHRLSAEPARAVLLWWKLAELYRTRLADRNSARVAYEITAKLAPGDPRPRDALARLLVDRGDPAWEPAANALRQSVRLSPLDAAPAQRLLKLHADAERWDAAFQVASVLVARGLDDAEAGELYRRLRPKFVARALTPLSPEQVDRLRHPDDDRDLSKLFSLAFAAWRPAVDLPISEEDYIATELLPEPFRKLLEYLCPLYGVTQPAVYRHADLGADAHVGALDPPVLLAGPAALALRDRVVLTFRLGRALTYLWPGRSAAGALPARQLKMALLATVTLAQPGLQIDDPGGQIAALRAQLAARPGLAREAAPVVERVLKNPQGTLNLSRYARGLARTADRIGLLMAGDLPTALRVVAESAVLGAEDDLVDFVLSEEYLAAREALGLSVAV